MKKLLVYFSLSLIISACSSNKSKVWFQKQDISDGIYPFPSAETNFETFKYQYNNNRKVWETAFNWMKNQDLKSLAVGKYPIDGENVFASVTEIIDKPFEDTKWESHKKYIDLQYVISGEEKIGIAPTTNAKVTNDYNPAKDVANYEINEADFVIANHKVFYLFFPEDAHRPNIKVNEEKVKKLVIKIKVAP